MDPEWNDSQPIYRQIRDRVVAMILDGLAGCIRLRDGRIFCNSRAIGIDKVGGKLHRHHSLPEPDQKPAP